MSMNQDETNCQEEISNLETADDGSDAEQPKLLPVLEWAERKKTERWLLCLAAVAAEWQPEQEAECVDRIPEAAFDAAIEQAIAAHERAKGEAGGVRKAKVLVHKDRLIGVIVRKLPPTEMTALFDGLENKNGKEATSYLRSRFTSRLLWPSLSVWSAIRDDLPGAESAMINHWVASMGTEAAEPTKKR